MKLGQNFLAGLSYSAWSAITSLASVPLLIHFLGVEAYGLVGLYVSMQGLLFILDVGLAPAVNREVARNCSLGSAADSANLLNVLVLVYWGASALIAGVFYFMAPLIATHWLKIGNLPVDSVTDSLVLLGFVIACRWPSALYLNALMGRQQLRTTSAIGIVNLTLAHGGGVLVVMLVSPTTQAYFAWQAVCAVIYTQLLRRYAWQAIGKRRDLPRNYAVLRRIWRFSVGMTGVSITGILLTQLDKVLLSRLLSLEDLGKYAAASLLASGLYVLLTPAFNTIYPRFSELVAGNQWQLLQQSYRNGTRLLCCVLFPIALGGAFFAYELIAVWTRNPELAASAAPVFALLIVGTAFNGAMHFPYALQLARGASWIPLLINACLLAIFIPLIVVLTSRFGMLGGAAAWMVINVIYLLGGSQLTHRLLMPGTGMNWLLRDVLTPFVLSMLLLALGSRLIDRGYWSELSVLVMGAGISSLVIVLVCLILLPAQARLALRWGLDKLSAAVNR